MIRIKCPKCANPLSIPDAQGGSVSACPKCGQKFRVPAAATKLADPSGPDAGPRPRPSSAKNATSPKNNRIQAVDAPASRGAKTARQQPPAEADAQGYGVGPAHETAPPPSSIDKRPVEDDVAGPEEQEEDLQATTPRRKKRRRKKKQESAGPKAAHIGLIVAGLLVVAAATAILFWIKPGSPKAPPDPGPVLAELEQVHAAIERDKTSPDQPVVGITLSGTFKPSLLGRLVVFPKLRKLNLGGTLTSDINLEWLEDVTTLRELNLSHTKVTGGGMQFLKKMVNLEELNLTQTLVDDVRLGELKGLKNLKKIYLDGTLASGLDLKAAIPGLEVVR